MRKKTDDAMHFGFGTTNKSACRRVMCRSNFSYFIDWVIPEDQFFLFDSIHKSLQFQSNVTQQFRFEFDFDKLTLTVSLKNYFPELNVSSTIARDRYQGMRCHSMIVHSEMIFFGYFFFFFG